MLSRDGGNNRRSFSDPSEEDRRRVGWREAAAVVPLGIRGARLVPTRPSWGATEAHTSRHSSPRRVSGRNRARHERRPGHVQAHRQRTPKHSGGRRKQDTGVPVIPKTGPRIFGRTSRDTRILAVNADSGSHTQPGGRNGASVAAAPAHAPTPTTGRRAHIEATRFAQLLQLVGEGSTNSLVIRSSLWTRASASATGTGPGKPPPPSPL